MNLINLSEEEVTMYNLLDSSNPEELHPHPNEVRWRNLARKLKQAYINNISTIEEFSKKEKELRFKLDFLTKQNNSIISDIEEIEKELENLKAQ